MVLELIDIFSTPYNNVNDYLKAASYAIHNCIDNGFNNFIEQQLKQQRKQPNWKTADQIKMSNALQTYQQKYAQSDKAQVDVEIKNFGMTMTPGQILYHGGVLNVDMSTNPIVLTEPLSTTINPMIAVGEAFHKGKAYHSGAFHLNVMKIINQDVKVYPFKANRRMSYEAEVLLEAGVRLEKIGDSIVDSNYKVCGLLPGSTRTVEKIVEAHIIEWKIV